MTARDSLVRQVEAGGIIKPWLILGPFYEDFSNRVHGLTFFEKPGSSVGRAVMAEIVEEAEGILISRPREGNETAFRGQPARWGLVRRPDRYLSWGTYNISNHLGLAFISTVVIPDEQGIRQWRLITRITSRVVVAINGMSVYDTDAHPVNQVNGCFEYNFTAALQPDENVLTVGMFRLGRMAQIECTWLDDTGEPFTSIAYDIGKFTPIPACIGYDRLEERKRLVLEHYASNQETHAIWTQLARYTLGRCDQVDESSIRETYEFIAARKDCADFVIQGILRLMYREREHRKLSTEINALMKDAVLGFKYWVDEPGDTVMYMGSENHRLLFHVAEWMAGQLFPTEEFTNSRQRGLYHAAKGRMYITEWLRQRGRFGFDEWHSNSYYPVNIAPLINVYDFAIDEDYKLRQIAGAVLDYVFFNLAADSLNGIFGTTHGRSYGIFIKYPDIESTSATCWLLYGVGSLTTGTSGMAPVSIADSRYTVPKILSDFATDNQAIVESKQRQGILSGTAPHANFCVYRTPDYMISGLQDHRKGEYEPSTHVAQVTLGKAVLFWSCPHTSSEGSGLRPDYWSGNTTLPRVIQYRNVMSLTWRLNELSWMTHCFFEQERFDQVRFEGNWAFARVKSGYVGIYSQHGMYVGEYGRYAGRELICDAPENTWLVECGREADWGSFDAFIDALISARIQGKDGALEYVSPSIGRFVTGWEVVPTVDDEPIQLNGYPLVDSPWAHADFGSGELSLHYGDKVYEIWFNQ